jgi:hypothetical protein
MSSTSETGHAKNVANFETLISFCVGYGTKYNPAKIAIQIPTLQNMLLDGKASITALDKEERPYRKAVGNREAAFEPLSKLTTRIINALSVSEASEETLKNAKTIARKIQGRRATPKTAPADGTTTPTPNTEETDTQISVSQMSYDSRVESLQKLVALLTSTPEYKPNETELKSASINSLHDDLEKLNTKVKDATTPYSNARIARNELLYTPKTGLVDTALAVKKYVSSVFTATSPQLKQISGIKFSKPNK